MQRPRIRAAQLRLGGEDVVERAVDHRVEPAVEASSFVASANSKFTDTPAVRALARARSMAAAEPSIPVAEKPWDA